jgi:REP element-mobilizing transposase RayT
MESVRIRTRGRLPHWEQSGSTYFVTFRLADSLPREALQRTAAQTQSKQIGRLLDAGRGKCILGNPKIAGIVWEALKRFDGDRYDLCAWCIMPNHVHVIFRPRGDWNIEDILHSWKSYSANRIQRQGPFQGAVWQREYFDHLVRFPGELTRLVRYVAENPARAGLKDWPWVEVIPGRF